MSKFQVFYPPALSIKGLLVSPDVNIAASRGFIGIGNVKYLSWALRSMVLRKFWFPFSSVPLLRADSCG